MAKKHREQLADGLHEHVAGMTPDFTLEEVHHALRGAGTDPDRLRTTPRTSARACLCTVRQGKARSSVSPASHRFHRPPEVLPNDAKHALAKATAWIKGLTQPPPIASNVQIARAYAKTAK
jgi:hypothetical protein